MPRVRESIEIDAPPEKVWAVVMDPCRLGDWVSAHRHARDLPDLPMGEGESFKQTLCLAGKSFDVAWTLVESRDGKLAVWEAVGPRKAKADVRYELAASSRGTRFDYSNEFEVPGGPLKFVAGGVAGAPARRQARKSLEALKRLLES